MSLANGRLNDYIFTNSEGTSALQNFIASRVYSSDSMMTKKLTEYHLYWKFYDNKHWAKDNKKFMSFNWTKAIVNKVNEYTIGSKGFEFNVEDILGKEIDPEFETAFEAHVNFVWNKNEKLKIASEMFQMGGITGDVYIFLWPDLDEGFIKFKVLDTRYVVPIFKDGDISNVEGYNYITVLTNNDKEYTQMVTEYRKGKVTTYYKKDTDKNSEKYEVKVEDNNLSFIPIVHIENSVNSGGYGGYSDVADIVKLNKVYNEMAEDVKEIIDYYTTPVTVITGGHVGNLVRGIGQIWSGLPAEANVQTLGLNEDLGSSMQYLELIRGAIHDLSGVPQEILSKVQHVSNTSAASLKILYYSLTMAADKKVVTYSSGITKINYMATIMSGIYFPESETMVSLLDTLPSSDIKKELNRYRAVPVFMYGLPNDRMAILLEGQVETQIGVGSRRSIMERLGTKNIPKELEEIDKDVEFRATMTPPANNQQQQGSIKIPQSILKK